MQTQIHKESWMISLGVIPPDPKLYINQATKNLMGDYQPRVYGKTLSKEARNKLRGDIKSILLIDINTRTAVAYKVLLIKKLMPRRTDGELLTMQAFCEYFKRCKKDLTSGVTDEQIIELHRSGMPIKHIAAKLDISWHSVRDRLICNNIIEGK